ncbi:MAG: DUF4386 domain-containing protein [Methanomassiliicoccales archaeon]
MTIKYYRKTAAIVGTLFIIATVTSIVGGFFLGSALEGPDYITELHEVETNVIVAAMFEIILATSLIGIGALMFPILKQHSEGLGMAYAGIRLAEAIFIVVSTISLLGMLTMGQDYALGNLDAISSESIGALLMSIREWSLLFGTFLFLGMGCLTLNYILYRSKLVPRWLSIWGLVGGVGILIYGALGLFGTETSSFDATTLLAAPIAVQEMVFATWLIVKGFNAPEV